jgi:transcriptional regulator GlxA family with amidase domain
MLKVERSFNMIRKIAVLFCCLTAFSVLLAAAEARPYTKNVAIVLYDGVEILDFAGPAEVFASASRYGTNGSENAFRVYTVSKTKDPLLSQGFVRITPEYSFEDSPKPDILVLPGGGGADLAKDPAWMEWIRTTGGGAEHVLTVCTGAFLAGKAGLLDGIEATTWYNAVPFLAEQFPNTRVQPGRRFVDSGKMITTAGVSAGIDGSLHLVARLLGKYVADRTAEYMEYKWSPESYLSARYAQLNPQLDEHGRALQQASIAVREGRPEEAIATYRSLTAKDKNDAAAWLALGRTLHNLKRYDEAIVAHREAAKGESQRGVSLYNLACGYALTGQREKALEAAAQAIEAGFRARWAYEEEPDLDAIRGDARFQALLARL